MGHAWLLKGGYRTFVVAFYSLIKISSATAREKIRNYYMRDDLLTSKLSHPAFACTLFTLITIVISTFYWYRKIHDEY